MRSPVISHADSTFFLFHLQLKNESSILKFNRFLLILIVIKVALYDLLFVFAPTKGFRPAEDFFNS